VWVFLSQSYKVICFDNFATGHRHNLKDLSTILISIWLKEIYAMRVSAQGSAGSRLCLAPSCLRFCTKIEWSGYKPMMLILFFLNMLVASGCQSKTVCVCGKFFDLMKLPKVEDVIESFFSPYTLKYVNEGVDIFSRTYGLETIGCVILMFWSKTRSKRCLCCGYS
jgi:UDP-N-acetylglucosamine 4-epimerase